MSKERNASTGRFTPTPEKAWQKPRTCEYCGKTFTVGYVQAAKTRFCGKSCSAKWRMRQPEIVARVHTKEVHARIGAKVSVWLGSTARGRANVDRIAALNPMQHAASREKVSRTLRAMGHRPPWTGGKGRGLTVPQQILVTALGPDWEAEYAVPVNPRRPELPTCLYIDIANPTTRHAIEVDGSTHRTIAVKAADARKTAFLHSLGWTVVRVWNEDVLKWQREGAPLMSLNLETAQSLKIQGDLFPLETI